MPKKRSFFPLTEKHFFVIPQTEVGFALPLFKFETLIGSSVSPKSVYIAITLDKDHTGFIYTEGREILFSTLVWEQYISLLRENTSWGFFLSVKKKCSHFDFGQTDVRCDL